MGLATHRTIRYVPAVVDKPLEKLLLNRVGKAIQQYRLIEDGDRILVALSGGKDSYALLALLDRLRARAPIAFELIPWHLDQQQPGYDGAPLRRWLEARGEPFEIASHDTYTVVVDRIPEGKTYCSLCSRLRRGIMYNAAEALGCNKIALGHHADDAVETLILNMMFAGQLSSMPPWLRSDDGRNQVIRPLILCWENDLAAYAEHMAFPILPCDLCGSQDNLQRQAVKQLLSTLERTHPHIKGSLLGALGNTRPTHLLDSDLWRTLGLGPDVRGTDAAA